MKVKELRVWGRDVLSTAGIDDAAIDSDILLSYASRIDRNSFILKSDDEVDKKVSEDFSALINKRKKRIPLQHIIGETSFYGYDFIVNKDVLIPRQETEILVELASKYLKDDSRVLDICTGSGCIPISLCLQNNRNGYFMATDISAAALDVAKLNTKKHKVNIDFRQSDLTLAIPKGQIFDIITSNPPYIKDSVIKELEPEVREYDPYIALSGGLDGLVFYKKIASSIRPFLARDGVLLLEIGYDQGDAVREIFYSENFKDIDIKKDYAGCNRVVIVKG